MKNRIPARLWPALLGVLAAAAVPAFSSRAADLVAGWAFEAVEADGVSIRSVVGNYVGVMEGAAILTGTGGGRPGAGGGRGFDVSKAHPGWLYLEASGDDNPMNRAAKNGQTTVVLWEKNNSNINSSSFWGIGEGFDRAYQFHIPWWEDGAIYFDTSGGCCGANQRLNMNVQSVFPDHDWLDWHHYAFINDGAYKAIYIDGRLLVEGHNFDPLPTAFTALTIGGANRGSPPDAVIDDFAIYKGILSVQRIQALAAGDSPFAPPMSLQIARTGANATVTWTGGSEPKLLTSGSVTGPWHEVVDAASPFTSPLAGAALFFLLRDGETYSSTCVGYVNRSVVAGLNLLHNPLNTGANLAADVLASAPDGTVVFKFADGGQQYTSNVKFFGRFTDESAAYPPGTGFFLRAPAASTLSFIGEVLQGSLTVPVVAGFNLVGSKVPQPGELGATLRYTATDGDQVYQFDIASGYKISTFEFGAWPPGEPTIDVGEGFLLRKQAAGSWDRTFSAQP